MAKERTLNAIKLKEFLDSMRVDTEPAEYQYVGNVKKIYVRMPVYGENGIDHFVQGYCLNTSEKTLMKLTGDVWKINFKDFHGMNYYILEPLLENCLEEKDADKKAREISEIESILNKLLERNIKLDFLDEVKGAMMNESLSDILKQMQDVLDSYKRFYK